MDNIKNVYQRLTGVDIESQMLLWDQRGKGYYGEYLLFTTLYPNIPGFCKILMNVQIPVNDKKTTEIDLLLIHETGLYVFEVKHFKGTIYGQVRDQKWTQYFRTSPNASFRNPILQNQYHIDALQKIFPNLPIYSFIVFTSPECELRTNCNMPNISVCHLHQLAYNLRGTFARPHLMDINGIETVFNRLMPYSPQSAQPVEVDGCIVPFAEYTSRIANDYIVMAENLQAKNQAAEKKHRKTLRLVITLAIIFCSLCDILVFLFCGMVYAYSSKAIHTQRQTTAQYAQYAEYGVTHNNE